jgi:hypothetical protein
MWAAEDVAFKYYATSLAGDVAEKEAIFIRLVSKHGIKMKAAVAVQRKLLEMIFTLYKTKKKYDKTFFKSNETENMDENKAA